MYVAETILALKEPHDPDPETGEEFPYNRVKVVGPSVISQPRAGWTGPDAAGVILVAVSNFGSTLDEPFGKVRQLYEVESVPAAPLVQPAPAPPRVYVETAPTPEEVFADKAPGVLPAEGLTRARTPNVSPLEEPRNPAVDGPLGGVDAPPSDAPVVPDSPL